MLIGFDWFSAGFDRFICVDRCYSVLVAYIYTLLTITDTHVLVFQAHVTASIRFPSPTDRRHTRESRPLKARAAMTRVALAKFGGAPTCLEQVAGWEVVLLMSDSESMTVCMDRHVKDKRDTTTC